MKSFKLFVMTAITIGFAALFLASCDDSPPGFTAVTDITGVPSGWVKDTELTLTGTVVPANATNKTIVWSVESAGDTGATISGNSLTATAAGTVTVKATIADGKADGEDYTKTFNIDIADSFVAVTSITGVPTAGTAGTALTLTGTVNPAEATNTTITWTVKSAGGTGASISGNTLNTTAAGTVTVTARVANGASLTTDYTQDIEITIGAAGNYTISLVDPDFVLIRGKSNIIELTTTRPIVGGVALIGTIDSSVIDEGVTNIGLEQYAYQVPMELWIQIGPNETQSTITVTIKLGDSMYSTPYADTTPLTVTLPIADPVFSQEHFYFGNTTSKIQITETQVIGRPTRNNSTGAFSGTSFIFTISNWGQIIDNKDGTYSVTITGTNNQTSDPTTNEHLKDYVNLNYEDDMTEITLRIQPPIYSPFYDIAWDLNDFSGSYCPGSIDLD